MSLSIKKESVRKAILEERRKMAFEEVYAKSALIQKRFMDTPLFRRSGKIALYSSFRNEPLTDEVFERAVKEGKEVYFPRVSAGDVRRLGFFRVTGLRELSSGYRDIAEPGQDRGESVEPAFFDLIVVPGVAFDTRGARVGYGMGYYDRALEGLRSPAVALAYEFQVIKENIPLEVHDIRVSLIVTEERTISPELD